MRKARKKQAEDFLKLLGQAHEEVKRLVGKGETPAAMDLLGQCQEGAMKLGELIEKAEGQGALTIPLLESYCEVVFQIYQGLAKALEIHEGTVPKAGQEAIGKKLGEAFTRIEESVQKDIPCGLKLCSSLIKRLCGIPWKASGKRRTMTPAVTFPLCRSHIMTGGRTASWGSATMKGACSRLMYR